MGKIMEGFKTLRGNPVYIKDNGRNISREEFPKFLKEMGFQRGAEIGVYKGEFTQFFVKEGLQMYGVDPWRAFYGQGRTQQVQERQDFLYKHAQGVLKPYENNVTLIRKDSMDAVLQFRDEYLDFVYIDGDHEFAHVAEDIVHWTKKVKKGGIVAGHDYWSTNPKAQNVICQVKPVVNAYTEAFGIKNLWIFGRDDLPNEKAVSWMFIREI